MQARSQTREPGASDVSPNVRPGPFEFSGVRGTLVRDREPHPWWLLTGGQTDRRVLVMADRRLLCPDSWLRLAGESSLCSQGRPAHLAGFSGRFSNSPSYPQVPSCWGLERPSLNRALASLCPPVSRR